LSLIVAKIFIPADTERKVVFVHWKLLRPACLSYPDSLGQAGGIGKTWCTLEG
jgi:hypothetical protein